MLGTIAPAKRFARTSGSEKAVEAQEKQLFTRKNALNADCFFVVASYIDSLKDIVRLWISIGCAMPAAHHVWRTILKRHLWVHRCMEIEDVIERLGCRQDSGGLLLIERMYTLRKCSRSGCLRDFREINNTHIFSAIATARATASAEAHVGITIESSNTACMYHPGRLQFKKLSCCGAASFRVQGCKHAYHDGSLYESIFLARDTDTRERVQESVQERDRGDTNVNNGKDRGSGRGDEGGRGGLDYKKEWK
jgi:hypothetical protein